jgi:hypothetical protein
MCPGTGLKLFIIIKGEIIMPEEKKQPYIQRKPGDLWTAEIWNDTQVQIKEDIETKVDAKVKALKDEIDKNGVNSQVQIEKDIATKVKALKDEIEQKGVNFAQNADKFAGKTSGEWESGLDQKYAPKIHDHEENGGYRRYFKQFTTDKPSAIITHKLKRFPLFEAYKLRPIFPLLTERRPRNCYFYLYSIEEEGVLIEFLKIKEDLFLIEDSQEIFLGVPMIEFLKEYEDTASLIERYGDIPPIKLIDEAFNKYLGDFGYEHSSFVEEVIGNGTGFKIKSVDVDKYRLAFKPEKIESVSLKPEENPVITVQHVDNNRLIVSFNPAIIKVSPRIMILLRA